MSLIIVTTWRYTQLRERIWRTVLSLLGGTLGLNNHIYQDNYYNSMRLAETLLDRNVRVCSTIRANRGIPRDLKGERKPAGSIVGALYHKL